MNTNSVTFFQNEPIVQIPENNELILAAWQLLNPANIGQIIRLGNNVGAKKVLFINNESFKKSKIKKTAGFSFDQMSWGFISESEFYSLLNGKMKLVILETCEGSKNIFCKKLPEKAIILAGNESFGLPPEIIHKSDEKIYIPMPGVCKSMNISHALTIAAFEWYRQKSG